MKSLAKLVFWLLLAATRAHAASDSSDAALRALVAGATPSVVMIEAVGGNGRVTNGAGLVWNDEGRIATALHVVAGARTILLRFHDGRRARARIVASDDPFDLALLASDSPVGAPALRIATGTPAVGSKVVAIGFPFGHAFSVSAGIVSGLDRTYDVASPHRFLQHDAALNPGSSGGPLIDLDGRVIGLNVAIPNGRRSDVGVGFAIPGAVVARVLETLSTRGRVAHGRLGARLRAVDHALARALGRDPGGALVEEVEADGPAARAGLRAGDLILQINDRPLGGPGEISEAVAGSVPGVTVQFAALRSDAPVSFRVTLGAARDSGETPTASAPSGAHGEAGIEFAANGHAAIRAVAPRSTAAAAGLRKGDVLLAIGGARVADGAEARRVLAASKADEVALLVQRDGVGARYVILSRQPDPLSRSPFDGNREIEGSSLF